MAGLSIPAYDQGIRTFEPAPGHRVPVRAPGHCPHTDPSMMRSLSRPLIRLTTLLALCALAPAAAAQANDSCSNPTPITGLGTFAFDNSSATTDGSPSSLCDFFGTQQIEHDVWFLWTATATESITITTCGLTGIDSKIAAYSDAGNCPPQSVIACNDDACGLQSSISISAVSGSSYLIRVGTFPGSPGGTGSFSIAAGGGGNCNPPSQGPDVIVGDLPEIADWGAVGNIAAYSIATTSCNVGDTELNWISNTNQHPVIGQNIYRLKDGRFEQLGQGWLKHGFFALQGSLCCNCSPSGAGGSRLGVGCSDPYSASLNGSQGGLGPRWEVNPHTGDFAYPFSTQGQGGDAIYKRIQVANADLDPSLNPGALYFGEGQYVTPDDAAAGNQNNNASWRQLTVGGFSGGSWNLSLVGITHREEPAILAWQANDASVDIQNVQVPGDGLVIVGSKCSDNGDGTWHYEYAVHNLNLNRGIGSFTIPLATGVTVTNVGFHDVDAHSGDPYSNADWTSQVLANSVTWFTQDYQTNPFANPIRWGTLYNFRFDADTAPQTMAATLGLYEPGSPGSVNVDVCVPTQGTGCSGNVSTYCTTSPNSAGPGETISATGSTSIAANNFTLHATGGPPSQFGLFYYGGAQLNQPFGDGVRCVGSGGAGLFRLNPPTLSDGLGGSSRLVDFTTAPAGGGAGTILPGSTWYFQHWYRDPGFGSFFFNLSNGLAATFCP